MQPPLRCLALPVGIVFLLLAIMPSDKVPLHCTSRYKHARCHSSRVSRLTINCHALFSYTLDHYPHCGGYLYLRGLLYGPHGTSCSFYPLRCEQSDPHKPGRNPEFTLHRYPSPRTRYSSAGCPAQASYPLNWGTTTSRGHLHGAARPNALPTWSSLGSAKRKVCTNVSSDYSHSC